MPNCSATAGRRRAFPDRRALPPRPGRAGDRETPARRSRASGNSAARSRVSGSEYSCALRDRDAVALGQLLQGFVETEPVDLHDELQHVAAFAAAEALVELVHGVHAEGRRLFVVERAQADVARAAGLAQAHVLAHDLHDIDRRFDLLDEVHLTRWSIIPRAREFYSGIGNVYGSRGGAYYQSYYSRICAMTFSSSGLARLVLMNSSCRAPALSAIAFQPFCVCTVTRTFTGPRASRTRADHAGDHRTDRIGIRRQQPLQEFAHPVDDTVLDLELVLRGAKAHSMPPLMASQGHEAAMCGHPAVDFVPVFTITRSS